jgi:hypothetical protein
MSFVGPGAAIGMSDDGLAVFGVDEDGKAAFKWTMTTGRVPLSVPFGGDIESAPGVHNWNGISGDGLTWFGSRSYVNPDTTISNFIRQPVIWSASTGVEPLTAETSSDVDFVMPWASSYDAWVIVGFDGNASRSFRWSRADGVQLLTSSPSGSAAFDTSSDGSVVVGYSGKEPGDFSYEAFIWSQSQGVLKLSEAGGAHGISGDGKTVILTRATGSQAASGFGTSLMVWRADTGVVDLTDEWVTNRYTLGENVSGVSQDGRYFTAGTFLFDLFPTVVPESSSCMIAVFLIMGCVAYRQLLRVSP